MSATDTTADQIRRVRAGSVEILLALDATLSKLVWIVEHTKRDMERANEHLEAHLKMSDAVLSLAANDPDVDPEDRRYLLMDIESLPSRVDAYVQKINERLRCMNL